MNTRTNIIAPFGKLILARDPVVTEHLKPGVRLILPDSARKLPATGLVLVHSRTRRFGEDLTGHRILYDKLAGVPWKLEGTEFITIPEAACLAVFEEESDMTRDELKVKVSDLIDETIPTNIELEQEHVDDLTDALEGTAIQELVDDEGEDEKEEK